MSDDAIYDEADRSCENGGREKTATASGNGTREKSARIGTSPANTPPPLFTPTFAGRVMYYVYAVLFIAILVLFDIVQRIALLIGPRWQERAASALNYCLLRSVGILGIKVQVSGSSSLPADQPLILVSNHQSMFDLCLIYTAFSKHRPRYIAKVELARGVPSISICLRSDGSALIDRSNPQQAIPEIKRLGAQMEAEKFAVIIFPEGTRGKDGALKKFRSGGFAALLESSPSANILPVAVDETWKLTAFKRGPMPLGATLKLQIGTPIDRNGKSTREMLKEAYRQVEGMLNALRTE